ncbi:hypothetical protein PF005_g233 [Phytophthora fragariae]|uniref:Uncharacterized protein n=1 Tax=Phytophthora fragariae TaxID=53985 RepID=A0A6A4F1M4_9STRA|nr:hypothetical protein PF003_g8314 [Phytophthora fragariae]KAE8950023.1 hypothetical protein PF009_g426 [Phytophthora fragariae]KAE9031256.1 hypothetical protein PF011_g201 [Phytophthora fragariae]KAE9140379.1 hypothetical protein PF010_g231 [Phytophthora fragariae]KAE9141090.1 hypothetical protein PF007_g387 [Phytophthora fragariae]
MATVAAGFNLKPPASGPPKRGSSLGPSAKLDATEREEDGLSYVYCVAAWVLVMHDSWQQRA